MRPVQKLEIKVGLLIVVAIVATIAMILLSDKITLERNYRLSVYLTDAGGLRIESPVTLSGITIGAVESISAVDNPSAPGAIRAIVKIKSSADIPQQASVSLVTSGLFGDASLAFNDDPMLHKKTDRLLAKDGTASVVAMPGFFDEASAQAKSILKSVNQLITPESAADAKRLVKNAADLTGEGAELAKTLNGQRERMVTILANLEATSASLRSSATKLDTVLDKVDGTLGRVDTRSAQILASIASAADSIDQTVKTNAANVAEVLVNLRAASASAAKVLATIDHGDGIISRLLIDPVLAKRIDDTTVDLAVTAKRIADSPSTVVWGASRSERKADQAERDRLKMQKAVNADLGAPATMPPAAPAPAK